MNSINYNYKYGATILRYLIGFAILKDFVTFAFNRSFLFYKTSIVSDELYFSIVRQFELNFIYIDLNDTNIVNYYLIVSILFSILFMVGILTRISTIILFFSLFLLKIRSLYLMDGADNVISAILPFFIFIDTISFSTKYENFKNNIYSKFPKLMEITVFLSVIFCYAIMIQICIVYLFSGIHKLYGDVWREGTALYYILNSEDFSPSYLNIAFTQSMFLVKIATWGTIFFQLTFPFCIWYKPLKKYYIFSGILLHVGIFIMMKIDNFSFIMIACYSIFITNSQYLNILKNIKCKIKPA